MKTDEFDYDLPADRIAQTPAEPREAARLLVDCGPGRPFGHRRVADLPDLVEPGDLLVVNDTRVLPARLHLRRAGGGAVEVLLLAEGQGRRWEALVRPSRKVRAGDELRGESGLTVTAHTPLGEGRWEVAFEGGEPVADLLARHGTVPLPPYITTPLPDPERYQTVYARRAASVAAPTAGLHLSAPVLESLARRGVVLGRLELVVGLGTFRPITTDRVEDHRMHAESYRIGPELLASLGEGRRVIAVGTTVVRALESWAATGEVEAATELYIHGDHHFAVVDRLLTNFHVPRSSLLVMVEAFMGPRWRDAYRVALEEGYRFLSFGDAMLVDRADRGRGQLR